MTRIKVTMRQLHYYKRNFKQHFYDILFILIKYREKCLIESTKNVNKFSTNQKSSLKMQNICLILLIL